MILLFNYDLFNIVNIFLLRFKSGMNASDFNALFPLFTGAFVIHIISLLLYLKITIYVHYIDEY